VVVFTHLAIGGYRGDRSDAAGRRRRRGRPGLVWSVMARALLGSHRLRSRRQDLQGGTRSCQRLVGRLGFWATRAGTDRGLAGGVACRGVERADPQPGRRAAWHLRWRLAAHVPERRALLRDG